MANDDAINARGGLTPINRPYGGQKYGVYKLTTSATAVVYTGQPMDLDANGGVVPAGTADNAPVLGPVVAFLDTDKAGLPSGMTTLSVEGSLPANTDSYCVIADDPNQEFMLQEDTGGSALTRSNVGNTVNGLPRTSSGSSLTGRSTFELDRSTVAADTGGQYTILGLVDIVNSDGTSNDFGNYGKIKVRINHHRLGGQPGVAI